MQAEVEEYDNYLRGDCYYYTLYVKQDEEYEELDSCGGFLGSDIMTNGIVETVGFGLSEAIESGEYETGTATRHVKTYYEF